MISPIKSYSYSPVYTNFTATPETSKTTDVAVEELEKGNQKKFKFKKFSEIDIGNQRSEVRNLTSEI